MRLLCSFRISPNFEFHALVAVAHLLTERAWLRSNVRNGQHPFIRTGSWSTAIIATMALKSFVFLSLLAFVLSYRAKFAPRQPSNPCPNGWHRYLDSCYYFEQRKMNFDKAEVRCLEKNSLMFTPETVEEYREVMRHSPMNYFTWVGLKQREGEREARWTSSGGIRPSLIDWLTLTPGTYSNGWSGSATCVARYNTPYSKPYSYFYFCGMDFHSICEKNNTLLKNIWDQSAIRF
ncbi:hypothetical protein RB195_020793 [Necator americanus]|uniref:C-type lectin domain-containing protein n=2 Tax=Necator americanus TaxID=51031 RepID=A0ABR1CM61_NECAM